MMVFSMPAHAGDFTILSGFQLAIFVAIDPLKASFHSLDQNYIPSLFFSECRSQLFRIEKSIVI